MEVISPVAYRAAIANNIILQRVVIALTLIIVVEVIAIASLFPLKDTKIKVVEFVDGTANFVRVTEPNQTIQGDALLIDYFVKKYVADRETWNKVDEQQRISYIQAVSSERVWSDMVAIFTHQKAPYARSDFKRAIKILRVSSISSDIRQVEFQTTDLYGAGQNNQNEVRGYWVATLKMSFKERTVAFEDADFNPLGLIVDEYSIVQRKNL